MAECGYGGTDGGGQGQPSTSYSGHPATHDLARTLSDLARSLENEESLNDTLTTRGGSDGRGPAARGVVQGDVDA
jgi:hypothetical protein